MKIKSKTNLCEYVYVQCIAYCTVYSAPNYIYDTHNNKVYSVPNYIYNIVNN
jgi:hypothetical protein